MLLNPYRFAVSTSSPLLTNLVSYWKLDEASGNRVDAHGGVTLFDASGVASAAGKINNAASFAGDGKALAPDATGNAALAIGGTSFSISMWVRFANKTAIRDAVSKVSASVAPNESSYTFRYDNSVDRFDWYIGGTNWVLCRANTFGAPAINTWYHIVVYVDLVANLSGISVNNTNHFVTPANLPSGGNGDFKIGLASTFLWSGQVDEVGYWKRMLTPAERTQLYNSGNGLAYPFT